MKSESAIKIKIFNSISGTAGLLLLNVVFTLAITTLLARHLGSEIFGIYTFIMTCLTLLLLPTKAGLSELVVREVSRYKSKNELALMKGGLRLAALSVSGYAVFVIFALYLFNQFFFIGSGDEKKGFFWALLLVPLMAFEGLRSGALRGLGKISFSLIPESVVRQFMVLFGICFFMFYGIDFDLDTAFFFHVIGASSAFIVGLYFLVKNLPEGIFKAESKKETSVWIKSFLPLSVFAGLQMLDSQISILLLANLATPQDVAIFKVAMMGSTLVVLGLMAINTVIGPKISELYFQSEHKQLQRLITFSARLSVLASLPVALIFAFWGDYIITIFFGVEYINVTDSLIIICFAQVVNASMGSVALILNMTGHDRKTIPAVLISLFINIILSLFLIPAYGVLGGAVGYSISMIIWNLILVFVVYKVTGLNSTFWNRNV